MQRLFNFSDTYCCIFIEQAGKDLFLILEIDSVPYLIHRGRENITGVSLSRVNMNAIFQDTLYMLINLCLRCVKQWVGWRCLKRIYQDHALEYQLPIKRNYIFGIQKHPSHLVQVIHSFHLTEIYETFPSCLWSIRATVMFAIAAIQGKSITS